MRVRRALVALPADRAVTSCMLPTVPRPPQSRASATARTAGVQCGDFRGDLGTRPSLETTSDPRAISAAPVSSTQPIPAAERCSRAASDMRRATATSGRSSRRPISSRACRSPPSPNHSTRRGSPLTSRSTEWPSWPRRRIRTDGGSTAATAVSGRWEMSPAGMPIPAERYPHRNTIPHCRDDVYRKSRIWRSFDGRSRPCGGHAGARRRNNSTFRGHLFEGSARLACDPGLAGRKSCQTERKCRSSVTSTDTLLFRSAAKCRACRRIRHFRVLH